MKWNASEDSRFLYIKKPLILLSTKAERGPMRDPDGLVLILVMVVILGEGRFRVRALIGQI